MATSHFDSNQIADQQQKSKLAIEAYLKLWNDSKVGSEIQKRPFGIKHFDKDNRGYHAQHVKLDDIEIKNFYPLNDALIQKVFEKAQSILQDLNGIDYGNLNQNVIKKAYIFEGLAAEFEQLQKKYTESNDKMVGPIIAELVRQVMKNCVDGMSIDECKNKILNRSKELFTSSFITDKTVGIPRSYGTTSMEQHHLNLLGLSKNDANTLLQAKITQIEFKAVTVNQLSTLLNIIHLKQAAEEMKVIFNDKEKTKSFFGTGHSDDFKNINTYIQANLPDSKGNFHIDGLIKIVEGYFEQWKKSETDPFQILNSNKNMNSHHSARMFALFLQKAYEAGIAKNDKLYPLVEHVTDKNAHAKGQPLLYPTLSAILAKLKVVHPNNELALAATARDMKDTAPPPAALSAAAAAAPPVVNAATSSTARMGQVMTLTAPPPRSNPMAAMARAAASAASAAAKNVVAKETTEAPPPQQHNTDKPAPSVTRKFT